VRLLAIFLVIGGLIAIGAPLVSADREPGNCKVKTCLASVRDNLDLTLISERSPYMRSERR
jgi:hypothetical protein